MILVFAGAGASRAVQGKPFPTTIEFLEGLPESITKSKPFEMIMWYLNSSLSEDETNDIEKLLWAAYELRDFFETCSDGSRIPGWFLTPNNYKFLNSNQPDIKSLGHNSLDYLSEVESLISSINAEVYNCYSRTPTKKDLQDNWIGFLQSITSFKEDIEIVTTNYDRVIESSISYIEGNIHRELILGYKTGIDIEIDLTLWKTREYGKTVKRTLGLTKLHGSVDWSTDKTRFLKSDPLFKGDHDRHVILYPGYKGTPDKEPFITFHDAFSAYLSKAKVVVFIGYAFRDQYVNDLISTFLKTSNVLVIDPNPVPNIPIDKSKYVQIEDYFDTASVKKLNNEIARVL